MVVSRNKTLGTRLGCLHFAAYDDFVDCNDGGGVSNGDGSENDGDVNDNFNYDDHGNGDDDNSDNNSDDDGDYDDNDDGDDNDESAEVTTDDEEQCTDIPLYTGSPVSCDEFNIIL